LSLLFLLQKEVKDLATPLIMRFERGFTKEVYFYTLKILPIMLIIVVLLVRLVAGPLVGKIMPKFVGQTDDFNGKLCNEKIT